MALPRFGVDGAISELNRGPARYGLDGLRGEREGPCQASISVEGQVSSCTPRDDA